MQVKIKKEEVKLPDFLIVGAAKSGTTSLYHYLKQHPQIFMPENKEPWFFSFNGMTTKDKEIFNRKKGIITNFDEYLNLFNSAKTSQILGEASTTYLYLHDETIKNIKKYYPNWRDLKTVIIIRNPVDRAYSHYLNDTACGGNVRPFEDVIKKWESNQLSKLDNYIDYGFYYDQIKAYKDNFNQVKVYLFEDLDTNSLSIIKDLYEFLCIDTSFFPDTTLKYNISANSSKFLNYLLYKSNLAKGTIKLMLPHSTRTKIKNFVIKKFTQKLHMKNHEQKILKEIYRENVSKLQYLINRDLTHWLN